MLVTRLLSTSAWLGIVAVSVAGLTAGPASAATICADLGTTPPSLLCSGAVDVAIDDDRDELTVTVESGASVVPPADRAMTLGGADQTVVNQGTIESTDDEAIRGTGARLTVDNSGTIRATEDRAIRLQGDADGSRIVNRVTGEIFSKDQAIRPDNDDRLADITVENYGLIRAEEGRTIQSRGSGTTVINHGTLDGGEEVVEARDNFRLENYGEIFIGERTRDDGKGGTETFLPEDQDGVQFASGTVDNYGLIRGTDDGIDFDEGTITNHAGAVIQTVGPSGNGIDIDELFDNGVDADERLNTLAKIDNRGLIEGPQGIGADAAAQNPVTVLNSGILRGTLGTAINLAPGQGDTLVELTGGGQIFGDILFGSGGTNTLVLDGLTDGAGIFSKVAAQGNGTFDVVFRNMTLSDMLAYRLMGDLFELDVATGNSRFRLNTHGASSFELEGVVRSSSEFAAYLGANGVAPIPLPAAGWLLLSGVATLGATARRRR